MIVPKSSEGLIGMPFPLTMYVPATMSEGLDSMPMGGILHSLSIPPQYFEYKKNHENFAKTVWVVKKVEK